LGVGVGGERGIGRSESEGGGRERRNEGELPTTRKRRRGRTAVLLRQMVGRLVKNGPGVANKWGEEEQHHQGAPVEGTAIINRGKRQETSKERLQLERKRRRRKGVWHKI